MPRLTRQATRSPEHALLPSPWRGIAVTAVVVTLTVVGLVSVGRGEPTPSVQPVDEDWLELMVSSRSAPVTAAAVFLDLLGSLQVTLPVRIAIAGFLALRRRWWHLSAFVAAVVMSELLIGTLKGLYDRPRPPGSLVETSGASFPSGHSIAASVTVVAAVIALVPPGRRAAWGGAAVAFSAVMALSRAYLGAHWLSDAVAGVLIGTSCALLTALGVGLLQRRRGAEQIDAGVAPTPDLSLDEDRR